MNSTFANQEDARLSVLLREWKVGVCLPPRFQEGVWRRIEREQARSQVHMWHAFSQWVDSVFRRPALAVSYVAVLLLVGLTPGYFRAQENSARAEAQWRMSYVQSVDPYQVPRN
jgi:hypothetical protein